MHYYRERHLDESVLKDDPLKFDYLLDESFSIGESGTSADFEYSTEGYINIKLPGYYLVKWSTTSHTGFLQDGSWFDLRYYNEEMGEWLPLGNGEGIEGLQGESAKNPAANSGIVPFEVSEAYIQEWGRFRIAIFNLSGSSLQLSRFSALKASIIIYGVPYFNYLINDLWQLLEAYEQDCCGLDLLDSIRDLEIVEAYQNEIITKLEIFKSCYEREMEWFFLPDTSGAEYTGSYNPVNFVTSPATNYEMLVTRVGYTYNFQMRVSNFTVNTNLPGNSSGSGNSSIKYFLAGGKGTVLEYFDFSDAPLFIPLAFSEGKSSGSSQGVMAAWVDASGIFLLGTYPPGNEPGCSFSFSLIFKDMAKKKEEDDFCTLPNI